MLNDEIRRQIDDIATEIDLLVFRLEQPPTSVDERQDLQRSLERLVRALRELADR